MDQGDRDYSPDTQFIVGQSVHLRPSSSHSHKDDNGRVVSLVRHSTRAMPDMDQPGPYLSQLDPSLTPVSPASGTVKQSGSPQDADGLRSNPRHPTSPGPRLLSGDSALLVNGNTRTLSHISFQPCLCICNRCKNSFTGMEGQTLCRRCSHTFKSQDNRNITFRKWLPCGQCRACQVTQDCGSCASCRNGRLNPESRKPVRCRKRKCLCPIRKNRADDLPLVTQVNILNSIPQCSDSEDFSVQFDDDDDDDGDDDDDEGGPKKRSRRSCGTCEACVCTKDCGTCDFCMDKPKFGGSNRKRQKCRLRQCQREAMRHLLPFELGQSEVLTHEVLELSKPRSYYLYTRKGSPHSSKGKLDFEFSDNEADHEMRSKGSLVGLRRQEEDRLRNSSFNGQISKRVDAGRMGLIKEKYLPGRGPETSTPPLLEADIRYKGSDASLLPQNLAYQSEHAEQRSKGSSESVQWTRETEVYTGEQHEEGTTPMITQIFSLADDAAAVNGIDLNHELLQLLESLRSAVLPVLWFSIMVEGPRLQLLQCSKLSTMADTVLQIEPSFCYHISVQGQPLLPTHPLYERHPRRLTSVAQVVALLLELEKYAVCQGFAPREPVQGQDPLVYERAATCDFLVPQKAERCASCMHPSQRH
ncbi:methyl-CpG-binding domain protein 1b [Chanos chanos]|uniref:Methyl-CpG-binding domain protein 1b n=1 Tax=Chanos chanos TaxID=29144 RepID=A0A6J2VPI0_CHACN|nr:uncharacterized protein LOC115814407 [Chanos chanos]